MEKTKICFKCGIEKPLCDYYAHPMMGDGHLNKCKECTKHDVRMKHDANMDNPNYVEKQRARCRDKYHRLNYVSRPHKEHTNPTKAVNKWLKTRGVDVENKESHHWNYNKIHDVFILHPRAHSLIHKDLKFDEVTKMFYQRSTGILIDTKKKHFEYIKKVFEDNNVNYEIDIYDE